MKKSSQWFERNTQQAVMSRVAILPVISRTGPGAKSVLESDSKMAGQGVFIVGKSLVGGDDRVRGTL